MTKGLQWKGVCYEDLGRLLGMGITFVLCVSSGITARAALFQDEDSTATWIWAKEYIHWAYYQGIVEGKGDKCFDADGIVTRAEAATMVVKFKGIDTEPYDMPCERFEDVGEEWYTKYINAAYDNGIMAGKSENIFDPEGQMTRAEAATVIVNVMGYEISEEDQEACFVDIEGEWYTPYINTAYGHEIVAGKGEGIFEPNAKVSRAEMVTMIHNTLNENYEVGAMRELSSWLSLLNGNYKLTNAEGQYVSFDAEKLKNGEVAYESNMENEDWDTMLGVPDGYSITIPSSNSFVLEVDSTHELDVTFCGKNSDVRVEGTNISKVRVDADGTIYLYGTDMDYTVSLRNVAHELEYSDSGAGDVVLKVVDKQLVEVIE